MQIVVVQPGDTLYSISKKYSISPALLESTNKIPNPDNLVIGQSIVIPIWGSYYFVEPGDSLFTLSEKFNLSTIQISRSNNLKAPYALEVGQRLYIPQTPRQMIFSGGYIDPEITGEKSEAVIDEVGKHLSSIQLFSYRVNSQGELIAPKLENEIIAATKQVGSTTLMVLTNIEEGGFSQEGATKILSDEDLQNKVLDECILVMKKKGYRGLDIDFEYLGAENRERYNQFLVKARTRLKPLGYLLSTALAPKTSELQVGVLYEGHDYEFQGKTVDFIFFMTYEWGWTKGAPRAVAPLDEVSKVMEYATSVVPKNKIMMGIPLYGYDWKLPFIEGVTRATAISSQQAIVLASRYGAKILFDEKAASPYYNYVDETGIEHEVWFEDARSIQAKFDLVKSLGIRGFFYWVLGRDFPQNWLLVEDNFIVKRY